MGKLNSNETNSNFGKANCFGQLLNIIAVVIALISVFVAYSANKKADEANTIAKEANKIALLGTSASVSMTQSGPGAVGIESCKDGDWFYIWFFTEPRIVFTNLGGVAVSLVKIEISSETSEAWAYGTGFWDKNDVYQNMSLATMKILPEEIPSGVSKDFTFVAVYLFKATRTQDEMTEFIRQNSGFSTKPFMWEFTFGNGQRIQYLDQNIFSAPTYAVNFDTECKWPFEKQ